MPLHDFECNYCLKEFEELHGINETVYCPVCLMACKPLIGKIAPFAINSAAVDAAISGTHADPKYRPRR